MSIKAKIEKIIFFIDDLDTRHHKRALTLKIGLWLIAPIEMLGFTLIRRAYKRFIQ